MKAKYSKAPSLLLISLLLHHGTSPNEKPYPVPSPPEPWDESNDVQTKSWKEACELLHSRKSSAGISFQLSHLGVFENHRLPARSGVRVFQESSSPNAWAIAFD